MEQQASLTLIAAARSSPLSQAQLKEIEQELKAHHAHVSFNSLYVQTSGDKDLKTSLRGLEKTDFFTKEIDTLLLDGSCHIAIHSAKDLPSPIPQGLKVIALTRGLDPSDCLVLKEGYTLNALPPGAIIATSSQKRELAVKQLRADLVFEDIRGTIEQRIAKLEGTLIDGVVVAKAALIRLGLTHLNCMTLPGETTRYQGQLAVVAREGDQDMWDLFACIDSRKDRTLL